MNEANQAIIDNSAYIHVVGGIDLEPIQRAAQSAAASLNDDESRHHHCMFSCGDGTRYEVLIARNEVHDRIAGPYIVATNYSALYPWNGNPTIMPEYAAEHWGGPSKNQWTGVVMAIFLNHVAEGLQ